MFLKNKALGRKVAAILATIAMLFTVGIGLGLNSTVVVFAAIAAWLISLFGMWVQAKLEKRYPDLFW